MHARGTVKASEFMHHDTHVKFLKNLLTQNVITVYNLYYSDPRMVASLLTNVDLYI